MSTLTTVNTEAVLATGRTVQWSHQASYTGAPADAAAGVAFDKPVSVYLSVRLREEIHRRTARVTMASLDTGATYTVTLNGTGINYATPSDEDDLITGLRDAIIANGTTNALVSVAALDADGEDVTSSAQPAVTLLITGKAEADYSIAISATAGALACVADAVTASGRLYMKPDGSKANNASGSTDAVPDWRLVSGGGSLSFERRGFFERINAAGSSRVYLELHTLAGDGSDGGGVTYSARVDLGRAVAA